MKQTTVLAVAMAMAFGIRAGDLYVDKDNAAASDTNPGTAAAPFKSIQAAVAYAATAASEYSFASGDTIWVKPGTYDNGGYEDANAFTNRVYITKPVRLVATGNKANTSIVGAWHSASTACGSAAVRCVRVASGGAGSILRGFTITKGATKSSASDNGDENKAGGVLTAGGASSVYLVECSVTHCRSYRYSALYSGTAVRTFFANNDAAYAWGQCARESYALNCIFWANGTSRYHYTPLEYGMAVNCSFVDNAANGLNDCKCYNSYQACAVYQHDAGKTDNYWEVYHPSTCANHIWTNVASVAVMSPTLGDFRLLPTFRGVNAGDASHLTKITLPAELEDDRYLDIDGRAIATTGTIHCGAVQAVGDPQGGRISLNFSTLSDDGLYSAHGSGNYIYSETYPTQHVVRAKPSAGNEIFGLRNEPRLGTVDGLYPDRQDRFFLMPSPNAKTNDTYEILQTTSVKWVDPENGDDDANDGTKAAPYKTIKKAMTFAASNQRTVVHCKAGTYDEGTAGGYCVTMPSAKYCFIRADEGPEKTFIKGGDNIGCVRMPYLGAMQGFTLAGANIPDGSNIATFRAEAQVCMLLDSVVSNNVGGTYQVIQGGILQRCLVTRNAMYGSCGLSYGTIFSSSVIARNAILPDCFIANGGTFYQTSLSATDCRSVGGVTCYNSIIEGSRSSSCAGAGNTVWGDDTLPSGFAVQDPLFAGVASGDLRVEPTSPTIGGGAKPTTSNYAAVDVRGWRMFSTSTYDGERLRFSAAGCPDAGAIQYDHPFTVRIGEAESGALVVSGDAKVGVTPVVQGEAVAFTVARGSSSFHYCTGFTVNGSFVSFDDFPSGWTTNYTVNGESLSLSAVLTNAFYAAANGSDANDGWTRTTPKTLQGAIDHAAKYGDTVVALAGTYDTGSRKIAESDSISSRIVISNGVTVVSDEGAEKTFIVGAPSTDAITSHGCGTNAVRCVWMCKNARMRGMTVTGGYMGRYVEGATDQGDMNVKAPAIYCADNSCHVENCIISNNTTTYRGGCWYGTHVGCRFIGNVSYRYNPGETPALFYGNAVNCLFEGNRGDDTCEYTALLVNCTFGRNNIRTDNVRGNVVFGPGSSYRVENCLFLEGGIGPAGGGLKNCVIVNDAGGAVPDFSTYAHTHENLIVTNAAAVGVGTDYKPLTKDSPAVDHGSNALYDTAAVEASDISGSQRIYNATIDVGAYEYDWRPDFGAILGKGVKVGTAAPEVTTNDLGQIFIPKGTFAFARTERNTRARNYALDVNVTGNGILTCIANGEKQTFGAGAHSIELTAALSAAFELSYEPGTDDAGGVILTSWNRTPDGLMVIVR